VNFREEEYISKVAKDAMESCKLVESGFEFVCNTPDEMIVFKKNENRSGFNYSAGGGDLTHIYW
jgi:hypothetical protein